MTEHWRCAHGLTLFDVCDACELELARERDQRLGPMVDEARRVIAAAPKDRYVEQFRREGRAQRQEAI